MKVSITDLEEFTSKKAVFAKLGDYKINVNDIPLKIALKVNEYHKNLVEDNKINIESIIDEIVIPIIQRSDEKITKKEIEEKFTYDQVMKIMNMIFECFFTAGTDPKNSEEPEENKKKD